MTRCDIGDVVRSRVQRSVASPFHSLMREESTRQEVNVERARVASGKHLLTLRESSRHFLCFPLHNTRDVHGDLYTPAAFSTVSLVGGAGFFSRFVVEQCLRRGISVTVLVRDFEKAKAAFLPIHARCAPRDAEVVEEHANDVPGGGLSVCYRYRAREGASSPPLQQLELVQGDVTCPESVQHAVRQASLVLYLASARYSSWWRPWTSGTASGCNQVDLGGLRNTILACSRVDAHLVAFVPLLNKFSWTSPLQWYRRVFVYRSGYLKATRQQERLLLNDDGSPSAHCVRGSDDPLRFTLFRVSDIVYPTFNERVAVAKNNSISDKLQLIRLQQGDVDARTLAIVVMHAVALCRSSIGSRLDVAGHMRHGVSLASVDDLLQGLRHE